MNTTSNKPKRIVIANAKGGCGKTTIATNLASYFANQNLNTLLFDHDSQGSSMLWLKNRPANIRRIMGTAAHIDPGNKTTRTWQARIPSGTQTIIVDTPASIGRFALLDLIRGANVILIPVLPSSIDMGAASAFISKLKKLTENVIPKIKIAIVANRVRCNSNSYKSLYNFIDSTGVPFIGTLRDTQNYAKAAQAGLGVHELNNGSTDKDIVQWRSILDWLQPYFTTPQKNFDLPAEARVVNCA